MFVIGALVAAAAVANAFPQGVTSAVSPPGAVPSSCKINHSGTFGLAVQTLGSSTGMKVVIEAREAMPQVPVSTIADGQVQAPPATAATASVPTSGSSAVTGLVTSATGVASTASTGAGQASSSNASGRSTSWVTVTSTVSVQCSSSNVSIHCTTFSFQPTETTGQTSKTSTGLSSTRASVTSTFSVSTLTVFITVTPTSTSGLFRNTTTQLTNTNTQTPITTTMNPITQISDGQVQATATQFSTSDPVDPTTTMVPVSTIADGQIQATHTPMPKMVRDFVQNVVERSFGFFRGAESLAVGSNPKPVGCLNSNTLSVSLQNGQLVDRLGRTGYIASNYQFQFDAPPQAGSLYTAGFSICENNTLALGGSTTFYRCLSGNFYNLYDRYWAKQCDPIQLIALQLEQC